MSSKYSGRNDDQNMMIADLARRLGRLETVGRIHPGTAGTVTEGEYNTPATTVTTGSFTNTHRIHGGVARIGVLLRLRVIVPGATTVEIQLLDAADSLVISPVALVPAGSTVHVTLSGRRPDLVPFRDTLIQARLASGVGTSRIAVLLAAQGDYMAETF